MLAPAIAKLLREHWLASHHKRPSDFVFVTKDGRGLDYRDAGKAFRAAIKAAGVTAPERLSLHSLRHAFASLLISQGLNVVYVSRQLGHANPTVTLGTYAHLYARADHATTAREATRRWEAPRSADERSSWVTAVVTDGRRTTSRTLCPGTRAGGLRPPP